MHACVMHGACPCCLYAGLVDTACTGQLAACNKPLYNCVKSFLENVTFRNAHLGEYHVLPFLASFSTLLGIYYVVATMTSNESSVFISCLPNQVTVIACDVSFRNGPLSYQSQKQFSRDGHRVMQCHAIMVYKGCWQ